MNGTTAMRAATYRRVSTEQQADEDATSLKTQTEQNDAYCAERRYQVVLREEDVHSGADLHERKGLTRIREAIRNREIDVLVVFAVDRLSRKQAHVAIIADECDRSGVTLECVTEDFERSAVGEFIRSAKAFAAEVEHEKIKERTLRGKLARVQGGKIYGFGSELYGYRRDKAAGVRLIHEPEAITVRRIFQWAAEGVPIRTIVRRLNDADVPAPSVRKRAFKDGRTPRWGHGALYRILTDPAYKGETYALRYQRRPGNGRPSPGLRAREDWLKLPEGTTPAIVEPAAWQAVQDQLAKNRGDGTRNAHRFYLLRGVVYCAVCGRKLRASPEKGGRVYRCSSRETPSGPCGGKRVPAEMVEAELWAQVAKRMKDPKLIETEVARLRASGDAAGLAADRESLSRTVARLEGELQKLGEGLRGYGPGDVMWRMVEGQIRQTERQRAEAQAMLDALDRKIAGQAAAMARIEGMRDYCATVAANLDGFGLPERRELLETLDIRVVANGREWRATGGIPTDQEEGILFQSSSCPGLRDRARHFWHGRCRRSCRR